MDPTTTLPTGTVTFLFTDIEDGGAAPGPGPRRRPLRGRKRGSPAFGCLACARRAVGTRPRSGQRRGPGPGTRLWEQQPRAMREALAQHDALLRAAIESHKGHRRESDLEREKHGV